MKLQNQKGELQTKIEELDDIFYKSKFFFPDGSIVELKGVMLAKNISLEIDQLRITSLYLKNLSNLSKMKGGVEDVIVIKMKFK